MIRMKRLLTLIISIDKNQMWAQVLYKRRFAPTIQSEAYWTEYWISSSFDSNSRHLYTPHMAHMWDTSAVTMSDESSTRRCFCCLLYSVLSPHLLLLISTLMFNELWFFAYIYRIVLSLSLSLSLSNL